MATISRPRAASSPAVPLGLKGSAPRRAPRRWMTRNAARTRGSTTRVPPSPSGAERGSQRQAARLTRLPRIAGNASIAGIPGSAEVVPAALVVGVAEVEVAMAAEVAGVALAAIVAGTGGGAGLAGIVELAGDAGGAGVAGSPGGCGAVGVMERL